MVDIEAIGAAERKTDPMQRNRFVAANGIEKPERRPATHIIFGVNFHPRHIGLSPKHHLVVLKAQPNPGFCGDQAAFIGGCRGHEPPNLQVDCNLPP